MTRFLINSICSGEFIEWVSNPLPANNNNNNNVKASSIHFMKYSRNARALWFAGAYHASLGFVYVSHAMEQSCKGSFSYTAALKSYALYYSWARAI